MKSNKKLLFLGFFLFVLFNLTDIFSAEKIIVKDPLSLLESSEKLPKEKFNKIREDICAYRMQVISQLINMLETEPSNEKKIQICYLLGEYRDPSAISILINNLLLEANSEIENLEHSLWGSYPAQEALMKIGYKAIPAMLEILKSNNDEKPRELAVGVISIVMTPDIAHFAIQRAADKEPDEQKKDNLLSALKYLPKPKN